MLTAIGDYVKSLDAFAYQFKLKFNKQDGTHNSYFGGFCTMIMRIILFLYVYRLITFLFSGDEDQYYQYAVETPKNYNVTVKDMNMVVFAYLYFWDKNGIKRNLKYNDETRRHIRIGFG